MSEKEQKRSGGLVALVVLLLIVTIVSAILATYAWAKYTSNQTGTTTANVAKWNVSFSEDKTNFVTNYTHVIGNQNLIAPGTAGSFDATINLNDTEVDADYLVTIESITVAYRDSANTGTPTIPQNMIFKDSDNNDITTAVTALANNANGTKIVIANSKSTKEGTENGMLTQDKKTRTIHNVLSWDWPYETGVYQVGGVNVANATEDQQDTEDGKKPVIITINYKVEAWQVKPTK